MSKGRKECMLPVVDPFFGSFMCDLEEGHEFECISDGLDLAVYRYMEEEEPENLKPVGWNI